MRPGASVPDARRQAGLSLLVVLILMVVMALAGLAVLRGTLLRERMSANMYDRSLAFQSAESTLRQAESAVREAAAAGTSIGVDCTASMPVACAFPPAGTYTGGGMGWSNGQKTQPLAAGVPQYQVQLLGVRDSTDELGLGYSAQTGQYAGGSGVPLESLYRIIARSHDPAVAPQRSVVVLQSNVVVK